MRRLSIGNTETPIVPHDDKPGDPLVLEVTSDQGDQAGIQQRVGNATHSQCEFEWWREASHLEGDRAKLKFLLDPGTPVRVVHVFSQLKESVLDRSGGDLDTSQPF